MIPRTRSRPPVGSSGSALRWSREDRRTNDRPQSGAATSAVWRIFSFVRSVLATPAGGAREPASRALPDQALAQRPRHRRRPIRNSVLAVDVLEVGLDRSRANRQLGSDLAPGEPAGGQLQDLELARR